MEVILGVDERELEYLRARFDEVAATHQRGLLLQEFLSVMGKWISRDVKEDETVIAARSLELFEQIDVNGDGTVEWDEFMAFVIAAGHLRLRTIGSDARSKQYIRSRKDVDHVTAHERIMSLHHSAGARAVVTCQVGGPVTCRVFDTNLLLRQEIRLGTDNPPQALSAAIVADASPPLLVASFSDTYIRVYVLDDGGQLQSEWKTGFLLTSLCWASAPRLLVAACRDLNVRAYSLNGRLVTQAKVHRDIIFHIESIPELRMVATASADHTICLLGDSDFRLRGRLKGHKKAVRQLAWSKEHFMLYSASFDSTAIGWDMSSKHEAMRCKGHHFPLIAVGMLPSEEHGHLPLAVTLDTQANVKIWNITRSANGLAVCLQSISMSTGLGQFIPSCMVAMFPLPKFVVGGPRMIAYHSAPLRKAAEILPALTIHNPRTGHCIVAFGTALKHYNPEAGMVDLQHHPTRADITCAMIDQRARKLVVGDNAGEVKVLNAMTGQTMKGMQAHQGRVIAAHFVAEDNIIVTAGADNCVCVLDERGTAKLEVLRKIVNASHGSALVAMAAMRSVSLIIVANDEGRLLFFDLQNLHVQGVYAAHAEAVSALDVLDSRALLVSTDRGGVVRLWSCACRDKPVCIAVVFNTVLSSGPVAGAQAEAPAAVFLTSTATAHVPPRDLDAVSSAALRFCSTNDAVELWVGSERGTVQSWIIRDAGALLKEIPEVDAVPKSRSYNPFQITEISIPQGLRPLSKGSGQARSQAALPPLARSTSTLSLRIHVEDRTLARASTTAQLAPVGKALGRSATSLRATDQPVSSGERQRQRRAALDAAAAEDAIVAKLVPAQVELSADGSVAPERARSWQAHVECVNHLHVMSSSPHIITTSDDATVVVWESDGTLQGVIRPNAPESTFRDEEEDPWLYKFDQHAVRADAEDRASALLDAARKEEGGEGKTLHSAAKHSSTSTLQRSASHRLVMALQESYASLPHEADKCPEAHKVAKRLAAHSNFSSEARRQGVGLRKSEQLGLLDDSDLALTRTRDFHQTVKSRMKLLRSMSHTSFKRSGSTLSLQSRPRRPPSPLKMRVPLYVQPTEQISSPNHQKSVEMMHTLKSIVTRAPSPIRRPHRTDDNTLQLLHHIQRDKVRLVGALELQRGAKRWAERVRRRIAARNAIAAAEAEARAALAAQAIEEERIRREHEVLGSDARHTLLPMYIILCAASALLAHGEQAPARDGHVTVGTLRDVRSTIDFNEEESVLLRTLRTNLGILERHERIPVMHVLQWMLPEPLEPELLLKMLQIVERDYARLLEAFGAMHGITTAAELAIYVCRIEEARIAMRAMDETNYGLLPANRVATFLTSISHTHIRMSRVERYITSHHQHMPTPFDPGRTHAPALDFADFCVIIKRFVWDVVKKDRLPEVGHVDSEGDHTPAGTHTPNVEREHWQDELDAEAQEGQHIEVSMSEH